MKILFLFLTLLFSQWAFCQKLNADAQIVKTAFEKLSKDSANKKLQEEYIISFPSTSREFLSVFETKFFDQLYMEYVEYLKALEQCAKSYPREVMNKIIQIGKNLVWNADAVSTLQHLNLVLATKHTVLFVSNFKSLPAQEQNKLITFFADVENHKAYLEYQDLINRLRSVGNKSIAKMLEQARVVRMARNND